MADGGNGGIEERERGDKDGRGQKSLSLSK